MDQAMESGQLLNGEESCVHEEIGKLQKIRGKPNKPPHPNTPIEWMSGLENIVNNDDGEGKIKKQFLEESGFAGFFFGRKTLTDVPVRNSAVGNRKHGEF